MIVKVADVMRRSVMTIGEEDDLGLARQMMVWGGVRHLPVMRQERLVGVISERDILRWRAERAGSEAMKAKVGEVMSKPGHYTSPEESIAIAAERMAANKIGCLAVLEVGKLAGIVTATDLLRAQLREDRPEERPKEPMPEPAPHSARDIMTPSPVTATPDEHVAQAIAKMSLAGVRHLPVVDASDRLVGMVTDREIPLLGDATHWNGKLPALRVKSVMSVDVPTVAPETGLEALLEAFADWRLSALPVVGPGQQLLGIVSYVDVLQDLAMGFAGQKDAA